MLCGTGADTELHVVYDIVELLDRRKSSGGEFAFLLHNQNNSFTVKSNVS